MLIKNFAIEMSRSHPMGAVIGLHPGTVDTRLSKPFQKGLPSGQLTEADDAASSLLDICAKVGPKDTGLVFDWNGKVIPA